MNRAKPLEFRHLDRDLYVHENLRVTSFNKLLDTGMGICRGSGVVMKEKGKWKIHHYGLSIAIPNENVDEITKMKNDFDQHIDSKIPTRDDPEPRIMQAFHSLCPLHFFFVQFSTCSVLD